MYFVCSLFSEQCPSLQKNLYFVSLNVKRFPFFILGKMPAGFWKNNFLRSATPGKDDPEPFITRILDRFFGKLGLVVGARPVVFIVIFLVAFGLLCVGLLKVSTSFDIVCS
jgi:hypothetical protein